MKLPIAFFGASAYVIPLIEYLKNDFDLKLVVTTEKETGIVPKYCVVNSIPYISVTSTKEFLNTKYQIQDAKSPVAILADFGLLVPQSVIDIFPKGIVNIHPSLLPIYRGPTPGMTALLHGDTATGISIMLLDKELDHGPLIGQVTTDIKPDDTSATLYPRLFQEGTELLKKVLPEYLEGKIQPQEQDHSKATFTEPHLTRESGFVEFYELSTMNHEILDRKIRAYFPWPTLWTRYSGEGRLRGKIMKFLPNPHRHSGEAQSVDTKILQKDRSWTSQDDVPFLIQVEGKKPVRVKDFLNGYPEAKEWLEKIVGK